MAVERALISVFDKTGIVDFAKRLVALKIEILSTGGTAKLFREAKVPVRDVSDFTGWPEMLGAASKPCTRKSTAAYSTAAKTPTIRRRRRNTDISPIDLVVVNLYPFEATSGQERSHRRRADRKHRHRRPDDAALGREKFRQRDGCHRSRRLRARADRMEAAKETSLATRVDLRAKFSRHLRATTE